MTSKLNRERLEELAAGQSGFNLRIATHEESQELARMALAAIDSESVLSLTDEQIDAVLDSRGNIEYVIADKRERLRMFAREILRAASPQSTNQQTRALVMWIKRISLALRSASPDNKLPKAAMGYLQNNGLISIADCLRGNNEEPPA